MANTITVATGSKTVAGDLTLFSAAGGDLFVAGGAVGKIERRDSNTQLTLSQGWQGPSLSGAAGWDILPLGPYWQSTITVSKAVSDLVGRWDAATPFRFDAFGSLAERDQYNGQGKGFVFLEIVDFRARLYIKLSNVDAASSWSGPVIIGTGGQVDFENAIATVVRDRDAADAGIRQAYAAADTDLRNAQVAGDSKISTDLANALLGVRSEFAAADSAIMSVQVALSAAVAANKLSVDQALSQLATFATTVSQVANGIVIKGRVTPEEFGAKADDQTFDNSDAINAMFREQWASGRYPTLRSGVTYACGKTLIFDPARNGLDGNAATFSFHLKTFVDPASQPELLTNGGFDSAANWIITTSTTMQPVFDGALKFTPPAGEQRFLEMGQRITAPAGSTLRITMKINAIVSQTVGINTYRDVTWALRRAGSDPNNSIVGGGQVGGSSWAYSNKEFSYKPGAIVTHDFNLSEDNPYLRLQTSAQIDLDYVSIKVIPNNVCWLLQVPPAAQGGSLRGHNIRDVRNVGIKGKPGAEAAFVIATQWDTPLYTSPPGTDLGQHSRAGFYNVNISDGVGVAFDFRNRTYLSNFFNCRATASIACIRTMPGALDAGENIVFTGGNIGAGQCGIDNEGGFELHLISVSIDFSRQWMKGAGNITMVAAHLETNQPIDPNAPLIDVYPGGHFKIQGKLQVNGSTELADTILAYPFRVAAGGILDIDAETPYNIQGTSGALCQGEGRFAFKARGGSSRAMSAITKRDDNHNLFGSAARFETDNIDLLTWTTSSSPGILQATRYEFDLITEGAFTGDFVRGDTISNVNGGGSATNTLTIGREIVMDGVFPGTVVIANPTTTSAQMSSKYNKAPANGVAGKWRLAARTRSGMQLSAAQKRNGSKSLRIYRGVGGINQVSYIAFPIEALHAAGFEMFWKVPPSGVAGQTASVYFTAQFARLFTQPGALVPTIAPGSQFITDQPVLNIDRSAGTDWTRMFFSTHRVDPQGSQHDGYMPAGMTHVVVAINTSTTPGGFEMFIADPCASQF